MAVRTDDGELVEQALAGRPEAFASLVDRYRGMLCGIAYCYLGNGDDAQDVAQEVFVYAYVHLRELREAGKLGAWLRRIALSRCADRLRRPDHPVVGLDQLPEVAALQRGMSGQQTAAVHEPWDQLATRIVVRNALGRLPEKTRLVVSLCYLGGYSHAEIADRLEVPLNTVRSRLQQAKRQLRAEIMPMVSDVLNESRPDPEFTRRVVAEAIRQAEEAERTHALGEVLRHCDEALEALEKLPPGDEQQRLKMETLQRKGAAARFPRGGAEAIRLWEQSVAIARSLGDPKAEADQWLRIAAHASGRKKAEACYHQALRLYREIDDAAGQGECLFFLGLRRLREHQWGEARGHFEQALPLLDGPGSVRLTCISRVILRLLREIGPAGFPTLLTWNASCDVLAGTAGAVRFVRHSDFRSLPNEGSVPEGIALLRARSLFAHHSPLGRLLDPSVAVGGAWSGPTWSYTAQPLHTVTAVVSSAARADVPAGSFDHCLLIEQVTTEPGRPAEVAAANPSPNHSLCGTRQAWYAPGVGLVQLRAESAASFHGTLQLQEFSLAEKTDAYLPLSVGNTWRYIWDGLPAGCTGQEIYRVAAHKGELRYVESHGYVGGHVAGPQ